ncbi:PTS sugar transporter, putative [Babesia ovis]|uniref:PTS sugar transporter, putative n=1 Tax=Babesia ovis TaxID=5869 RepID=A0A9W5T9V5_BABOV|nr:PTS sugar transporter, putative [Babesia ovis]
MLCVRAVLRPRCDAILAARVASRGLATAAGADTSASWSSSTKADERKTTNEGNSKAAVPTQAPAVLMEPNTLCKAVMQASKEGKRNKATWKAHVRKAIDIKDQLTFKHIAIIIHSCANATISKEQLYGLIHGLETNVIAHLELLVSNFIRGDAGIDLYHIYSILHGAKLAGYGNCDMTLLLKKAGLAQFEWIYNKTEVILKPFIFEDIAGIVHALTQMHVELDPKDVALVHDVYIKLYKLDRGSTISHRAFAIMANTLERLGCHTPALGNIVMEYLQRNIDRMYNIKDVAMIYCASARIDSALQSNGEWQRNKSLLAGESQVGSSQPGLDVGENSTTVTNGGWGFNTVTDETKVIPSNCAQVVTPADHNTVVPTVAAEPTGDIIAITKVVIDKLLQDKGFETDAQSNANIAAHAAPYAEIERGLLLQRFGDYISGAIQNVMLKTDLDCTSLVYLMRCAIKLDRIGDAMLMLSAQNINHVGMLGGPLEFVKHMANIQALRTKQDDEKVAKVLDSIAVTNMLCYKNRLQRPPVSMKPKIQRRRNLRELIEAEKGNGDNVENICIHNDLDKCYKSAIGFKLCAKTLAAVSAFNGHKAACDIAQHMVITMEHIFTVGGSVDLESVAAAASGLYKFRIKNHNLLQRMALETRKQLDAVRHPSMLVQILVAYAKLGCPFNRDINRGLIASPGIKRISRSNHWINNQRPYEQLFVDSCNYIMAHKMVDYLNSQATVNCIFALALSGMGCRLTRFLYALLSKLRKEWKELVRCPEMDKQMKIAIRVLQKGCSKRNRVLSSELKKLQKVQHSHPNYALVNIDDLRMSHDARRRTLSGKIPSHSATFLDVRPYLSTYLYRKDGQNCLKSSNKEPFIKDIRYYNQFPKFAEGKYSLDSLHIDHEIVGSKALTRDEIAAFISAIGNVKSYCLLPRGEVKVSYHADINDKDQNPIVIPVETCVSNYTLGMVKQAFQKSDHMAEWMKQLEEREFKMISVEQLFVEPAEINPKRERELFVQEFNAILTEHGIKRRWVEPIGWKYIPSQQLLGVYAKVVPHDICFSWAFRLLPGHKPLVINQVSFKLRNLYNKRLKDKGISVTKIGTWKLAQSEVHTYDTPGFKLRSYSDLKLQMIKRKRQQRRTTESEHPQLKEIALHKPQFIEVSGGGRLRFHLLLKIMNMLDTLMEGKQTGYTPGDPATLTVGGDPHPHPFWVRILNIMVNGKFFKYVPLLVFYVQQDDMYHLCTRDIILQPDAKPSMWNPWQRNYSMRHMELVPRAYRGVAFADTHQFQITDDHIKQILMRYKPLSHLDITGYCNGVTNQMKEKVKNIIHIEPQKQLMVNIVH